MTTKQFVRFAAFIKRDLERSKAFGAAEEKRTREAATYAAGVFADVAIVDNPRFDRRKFMEACGL